VAESRDGAWSQHKYAVGSIRGLSRVIGLGAAIGPDGNPIPPAPQGRSFANRAKDLIAKNDEIREAANALMVNPVGWANLRLIYEIVKGMMSQRADRKDWMALVNLGWISESNSNRFYDTATFYSHGFRRAPLKCSPPMPIEEGEKIARDLLWRLIDHKQPN
jgi:hypothetical protein